jgi:hypothetical protein
LNELVVDARVGHPLIGVDEGVGGMPEGEGLQRCQSLVPLLSNFLDTLHKHLGLFKHVHA